MRVAINHETLYRYESEASYSIQYLRLTPLSGLNQRVVSWRLSAPGTLTPWIDSFGNSAHVLVVDEPHDEIRINAVGEVEIADGGRPLLGDGELHPPELYLRTTPLTEPEETVASFAQGFRAGFDRGQRVGLDALMYGIRSNVEYKPGATTSATTVKEALAARAGVCQDHAHLFISCARALGVPARYVSGYLCSDANGGGAGTAQMASHAWAEAWVEGAGWLSFDVTNRISNTRAHVRVAVGLDYLDAAPVRGVRRNGGEESLDIQVHVNDARNDAPQAQSIHQQ